MGSYIKAISYYLPDEVLTNEDLSRHFPTLRIDDLTRLTGVHERHISGQDETAVDLAINSAERLFEEHHIDRGEIDFVLLNTQWSDYITPSSACVIQHSLGISQAAGTLDISQGCTGYIYGLSMAKGLIETGQAQQVLLLTSETITKSVHPEDKSNRAIFGDGASASLITRSEEPDSGIGGFMFGTDGSGFEEIIIRYGGARFPLNRYQAEDYKDSYGNIRNESCFFMNGSAIVTFSVKVVPKIPDASLKKAGLAFEEVDFFIFHQANRIILETIMKKNGIPADKTIIYLEKVGNTVSSTIPIALYHALEKGQVKKGDTVLLAAFGVGLSWAGTIIKI